MKNLKGNAEQLTFANLCVTMPEYAQPVKGRNVNRLKPNRDMQMLNKKIVCILENISDSFFIIDNRWRFVYLNAAAEDFCSEKKEDLLGRSVWGKLPELIYSPFYKYFHNAVLNRSSENFEMYYPKKNKWLEINIYPFQAGVSFYFRDISGRKQFESEMSRLDRLSLVGQMAAGIGHEIRNPLTTVRGFLQLLSDKDSCLQYREFFSLMIEELDRANTIITEFLSLDKDRAIRLKMKNINRIIEAILPLISTEANEKKINMNINLEEVPDMLVDEKEICQLILNLVQNGFEAMTAGGELSIGTSMGNGEVILSVQDQGKGIPDDILEKLGTPFFTTKDSGTGLGLAICYSIAVRHGAVINIETGAGGTTFFVRFKQQN